MFKILCIVVVYFCATSVFANKSTVSVANKSSESWVSQSPGDNASKSEMRPNVFPHDKEKDTLQRLQLGIFPDRTEVEGIVVRLNKLDFETWITPFKDGYAVSIGAFSSQTNLQRAMQRLKEEGYSDKIQVVEVDKTTQHSQTIAPRQIARSTLFDAKGSQLKEQFVPRKKYKKLEKKVEHLETQMQRLINGKTPVKQESESATTPDEQAKTKSSEFDIQKEPAVTPTENEDSHAEQDQEESVMDGDRQREAEDAKRQMDMFLRQQTVLFKRGELQLDFGLNYSQDTSVTTCFNPDTSSAFCPKGSRPVPKQSTRSVDASVGVTYGIADDLALSFSVPYSYNELEDDLTPFEVNGAQVNHNDHLGIGDIGGSLRYTAWPERGSAPSITLSLNAKSPTGDDEKRLGTGFWNVGAGMSFTKTFDPVVFFGSVGYTSTLEKQHVDPGDQISYAFGGGFSLNDRVSVSTAFSGSTVLRTEVNGREIPGSAQDISSLQFSSTIKISKALFLEPFVAFGLTRESGDYTVGLRVPYRFGDRFPIPFFHN